MEIPNYLLGALHPHGNVSVRRCILSFVNLLPSRGKEQRKVEMTIQKTQTEDFCTCSPLATLLATAHTLAPLCSGNDKSENPNRRLFCTCSPLATLLTTTHILAPLCFSSNNEIPLSKYNGFTF